MALKAVTDPNLLSQLDAGAPTRKPVTDPALLAQLNEPSEAVAEPFVRDPTEVDQRSGKTRGQLESELAEYERTADSSTMRAVKNVGYETLRGGGAALKNLAQGVLSLPATLMDAPALTFNAGTELYDMARGPQLSDLVTGEQPPARIPTYFMDSVRALDSPELAPRNRTENIVGAIEQSLGGALTGVGAGQTLARSADDVVSGIGQTLAANPAIQGVSAVSGTGAAELAEDAGQGTLGQIISGLAGAAAPGAVAGSSAALTRAGFRGGEAGRQQVQRNIETFSRAGTTPSVGQATEGRVMRGAESLLSRTPGGAGPVIKKAETQADDLSAAIELRAAKLMRRTSAEQTGRQIERSVRGEGGFVEQFKGRQAKLYGALDKFMPKGTRVDVAKTKDALAALNAEIPGAPNVSKFFQNAKIKGIEGALKKDTEGMGSVAANPEFADAFAGAKLSADDAALFEDFLADGKLPFEALQKLRTLVGNELADAGLASDVPRSKWKALYAALSDDMGASVADNQQASAAWKRANTFTRAGMKRIEAIESVLDRSGGPEAVFRAATANTKEGATTLRSLMQSVDGDGQKMISATVLRRLGLAKAGVQGDLGDQFSTETFLTNWNLLSKEAKGTLFDRYGPSFRKDMDVVATVASNLRQGSQVFRNPSGTAQAQTQAATAGALALSVITGQVGAAGSIAATVGGANLLSRLMTNPRFVRWLAKSTEVPKGSYAAQVNRLAGMARNSGDEDLARAAALLEQRNQSEDDER